MSTPFHLLQKLAAFAVLAALASCSRGNYVALPSTEAYHGSHRIASTRVDAAPPTVATVEEPAAEATPPVVAAPPQPAAKAMHKRGAAKRPVVAQPVAAKAVVEQPSAAVPQPAVHQAKLNPAQKVLVAKLTRKATKLQARQPHNFAEAKAPASKIGRAAIVALIGLLLLILGGAAGVSILALIGLIALIVGVVMLIVALVNS